jgi:hypothetical protein
MMNMCECCNRRTTLYYVRRTDEYLCETCEAAAVAESTVKCQVKEDE